MPLRLFQRAAMFCLVDMKCLSRLLLPALMGLCLGMTLSMMYAPFSEDSCESFMASQDPQALIKLRDTKSVDSAADDMYEPHQLDADSIDQSAYKLDFKSGTKFYRPKFAATELGIRQKLFVAVLSSKETLATRAVAVNKTLSRYVTKTVFFVDEKAGTIPSEMMIVNFKDGHNHLLPMNVLKYVIGRYGREYDYYMFLTDKGYVRGEQIFDMVSLISVSKHVHLGAPRAAEGRKTYCTLDGGVIISQSILAQVNSSLKWCWDNCHSSDQSLNLGKCLLHASDIECQSTVGNKVYTVYPVKNFNFDTDIEALREQVEFNKSLSVFPMPDDINHYKLHRYFCEVELNSTRHQIQEMKDKILYMSQFGPGGRDSVSWPVGIPEPYKPKSRFDLIRWDYFTETHIFFQDDFTNVKLLTGADKLDIQDIIKFSMDKLSNKYGNRFLYSHLINGYRRFDPQRGMEYMMDLALADTTLPPTITGDSQVWPTVEKRVFLVRPLGEVEIVPMPYVTESSRVHIVVPVAASDRDGLGTFLENYTHLQAKSGDSLALTVVFLYRSLPSSEAADEFSVQKSMCKFYSSKNQGGIPTKTINFAFNETYLPEYKILDVVSSMLDKEALIFMGTAGMLLNIEMLNRVRMNTIPGWQVFFPIGFWQFRPNLIYDKKPYPTQIEFSNKIGHYDVLSYEHGSFYNKDYLEARKSLTDTELFSYDIHEMFVRAHKLHVFRAVEPELKHYYQQLDCSTSSPSALYQRCQERKYQSLGTRSQLAKHIFYYQAQKSAPEAAAASNQISTSKPSASEDKKTGVLNEASEGKNSELEAGKSQRKHLRAKSGIVPNPRGGPPETGKDVQRNVP